MEEELNKIQKEIEKTMKQIEKGFNEIKKKMEEMKGKVYVHDIKTKENWEKYMKGIIESYEKKIKELKVLKNNLESESLYT